MLSEKLRGGYGTKAALVEDDVDYSESSNTAATLHEERLTSRDTGLLDQHGNKIYFHERRNQIGFIVK
jgi:hypothetical protein